MELITSEVRLSLGPTSSSALHCTPTTPCHHISSYLNITHNTIQVNSINPCWNVVSSGSSFLYQKERADWRQRRVGDSDNNGGLTSSLLVLPWFYSAGRFDLYESIQGTKTRYKHITHPPLDLRVFVTKTQALLHRPANLGFRRQWLFIVELPHRIRNLNTKIQLYPKDVELRLE